MFKTYKQLKKRFNEIKQPYLELRRRGYGVVVVNLITQHHCFLSKSIKNVTDELLKSSIDALTCTDRQIEQLQQQAIRQRDIAKEGISIALAQNLGQYDPVPPGIVERLGHEEYDVCFVEHIVDIYFNECTRLKHIERLGSHVDQ